MTFRPAVSALAVMAAALLTVAGAANAPAQYSVLPNAVPTDANGGGPYPVDYYAMIALGRPPEVTGDYGYHYLESPYTGTTYADPAYYAGQGALARWNRIRPSAGAGRPVRSSGRSVHTAQVVVSEPRIAVERPTRAVRPAGCRSCGVPAELR